MKETILGVIAFIFALAYNIILFTLNIEYANDKFMNAATSLMAVNTMKDAIILGIILHRMFLG